MSIRNQHRAIAFYATVLAGMFISTGALYGQTQYLKYLDSTRNLKLGDSEQRVTTALRQYATESWSELTNLHLSRLQFLHGQRVLAWLTHPKRQTGEGYILAVFSSDDKLTDLLRFEPRLRVFPLLRGSYAQRLASVKKGMGVEEMYRLIGQDTPSRYFRGKDGRWLVGFSYQGSGYDFWLYDVDASSGIIVDIHVSGI